MNVLLVVAAILACANGGLIGAPSSRILEGPSSKTTIVGPDGSIISAVQPGGKIITDESLGAVVQAIPVVSIVPPTPALVETPVEVQSAVLTNGLSTKTVVAGPSGTIIASEPASVLTAVASPAVVPDLTARTIVAGPSATIVASEPLGASPGLLVSPGLIAGSSLWANGRTGIAVVAGPSGTITASEPLSELVAAPLAAAW